MESSSAKTIDGTVPFSILATVFLVLCVSLLTATFIIETPIYRYYCLGAFTSLLGAAVLQLLVTKAVIWPATIALRRQRLRAPGSADLIV